MCPLFGGSTAVWGSPYIYIGVLYSEGPFSEVPQYLLMTTVTCNCVDNHVRDPALHVGLQHEGEFGGPRVLWVRTYNHSRQNRLCPIKKYREREKGMSSCCNEALKGMSCCIHLESVPVVHPNVTVSKHCSRASQPHPVL